MPPDYSDPYRTKPTTWRSRITRESLSQPMKRALREAIQDKGVLNCESNTQKSLYDHNLCDLNGNLTIEGRVVAIESSSLEKQVLALDLPFKSIELESRKNDDPEIRLLNYLINDCGYKDGCFTEGGIFFTLFACMSLKLIEEAWRKHSLTHPLYRDYHLEYGESAVKDTIRSYLYNGPIGSIDLLDLMENLPNVSAKDRPSPYKYLVPQVLTAIKTSTKRYIINSFSTLTKWRKESGIRGAVWPWKENLRENRSFLISIYKILGNDTLYNVAKTFYTDPGVFGQGWPDLLVIDRNNDIKLIEVKTTDKLLRSQILTTSEMKKLFPIEIIQVK